MRRMNTTNWRSCTSALRQQARDAIEAGADGLAHLFAGSEPTADFADFVARHHVFVVPTLAVLESVSGGRGGESLANDRLFAPYLTTANIANLHKSFPKRGSSLDVQHAEQRSARAARGGRVDSGGNRRTQSRHGAWRKHPSRARVVGAVWNDTGRRLGGGDGGSCGDLSFGRPRTDCAGKRADLVLVKGDPTQDILATREIVAVWKAGARVDRDRRRAEIERAKLEVKQEPAAIASSDGKLKVISDFEDKQPTAKFGAGWSVSTDSIAGGKSTGEMQAVAGGANMSQQALKVAGKIDGGLPYAWAGAMFSPGARVFAPANLSATKELQFWAKGDGKTYRVMIFTESGGRIPAQQTFASEKEWKKYSMPLSKFNGTDGHDVAAILFVGGPKAGAFEFWLDDVGLGSGQ